MFDIKASSLLADYDRETITNLYQPIIGHTALAVYFTFWSEAKNQRIISMSSHEQILLRMKISTGEFIEARKVLEAVGLVKTRLEKVQQFHIYHYELFAPRSPHGFFNDTLLFGLFIQNLGENEANRLKRIYATSEAQVDGEDISSSFNDVFHPDFEDAAFLIASSKDDKTIGRNKSKIDTEFSYERFFESLKAVSQINEKALTKGELKKVERLATLYGVSEEVVAEKVANSYIAENDKGERIDINQVNEDLKNEVNYGTRSISKRSSKKNLVVGESDLASKIKLYETKSPREVLALLQNNTKVAKADLNILEMLANDYKLNDPVICVIVDFVLQKNHNVLSRYSVEKIASSISRENIVTAIDAMNYLNNSYSKTNKTKASKSSYSKKEEVEENKPEVMSEEEQEELIAFFKDR